ncbi:MAG TPA: tannase/feruloyl esterase family alpha/beta hydrolase [Acidobacteriaceae bacterium]
MAIALKGLPAFCRVVASVKPVQNSDIKIEVWMPLSNWNGKFLGHGNGGFAGYLQYGGLQQALMAGYATASTDTGHIGGAADAEWAIGHPEKVIDFGYRGIHEMTVKAKLIVAAFYRKSPRYSYFSGCSNGGRAAMMEAERFPSDYSGILAGAPANNWTLAMAGFVANLQAMSPPGSQIPAPKLELLHAAVLRKCDAQDGLKDGILTDPRTCRFDPAELLCKTGTTDGCLTAPQVEAVQKLYAGLKDAHGNVLYPGFVPGGELGAGGWVGWLDAPVLMNSGQFLFGPRYFADVVYGNPKWDPYGFQVDREVKASRDKVGDTIAATNTDLSPLAKAGGKLILYQGWSDAAIAPMNIVHYYGEIHAGQPPDSFVRLYMIPGMQHCAGGDGAVDFGQNAFSHDLQHSIFSNLENWVENGVAPSAIVAWQHKSPVSLDESDVTMTRPICPYPQVPRYKGSGDTQKATNFMCK